MRRSRCFTTRLEAGDWARDAEREILLSGPRLGATKTLADLFSRYADEVSSGKRGERWERLRLAKLARESLGPVQLTKAFPAVFASWRDQRLREVAPATVTREMQLISHALTIARREWGWITENPMRDVVKPKASPPRDRRIPVAEIDQIATAASYDLGARPPELTRAVQRVVHAFLFAIETGMRAGEIVGLTWNDVDTRTGVAHLTKTKNGLPRDVPLSTTAIRLLEELPPGDSNHRCFRVVSASLDVLFRRIRDKAGIENLHFHDTRHEAITRLARKIDVLTLARMVGHRDIKMLQIYYNESAADIAKRLG